MIRKDHHPKVKCKCLWCKEVFYVHYYRLFQRSTGSVRRGVACSDQCRKKVFRSWILLGMERDGEYQALKRERDKLRRLVMEQQKRKGGKNGRRE